MPTDEAIAALVDEATPPDVKRANADLIANAPASDPAEAIESLSRLVALASTAMLSGHADPGIVDKITPDLRSRSPCRHQAQCSQSI